MTPYSMDLKALYILRQNVRELLARRRETETVLAQAIGFRSRSSLNKILNGHRKGFELWRLDKLSAFFGLPVYQLFQPGISPLVERRNAGERRTGRDRRIGRSHIRPDDPTPTPKTKGHRRLPKPNRS